MNIPVVTGLTLEEESDVNSDGSVNTCIIAKWDSVDYGDLMGYAVSISEDGINFRSVANTQDNNIRIPDCIVGKKIFSIHSAATESV